MKLLFRAGLVLLAFALAGYFGNFFQWRNARETNARIISAHEQWLRRAPGNINVELEYSVSGRTHRGKTSIAPSRLSEVGSVLAVYYLEDDPDKMVPVEVLRSKQRLIIGAGALGLVLSVLGVAFKRRQGAATAPSASSVSP